MAPVQVLQRLQGHTGQNLCMINISIQFELMYSGNCKIQCECNTTINIEYSLQEKQNTIPEELGKDAKSVAALQRRHAQFENDLVSLGTQVMKTSNFYVITPDSS